MFIFETKSFLYSKYFKTMAISACIKGTIYVIQALYNPQPKKLNCQIDFRVLCI